MVLLRGLARVRIEMSDDLFKAVLEKFERGGNQYFQLIDVHEGLPEDSLLHVEVETLITIHGAATYIVNPKNERWL